MHGHETEDYSAKFGVLTCSSTRTEENDDSGKRLQELLKQNGHKVADYKVVRDDAATIKNTVLEFLDHCDAVIITGGTGITRYDVTVQSVSQIAEYEMTGFGHIFAYLSYRDIGSSAALSRATGFVVRRKPVFCLPGSPAGAELGLREIILKQIAHMHHELNR